MSETFYEIRRSGDMDKTTWIGTTGLSREFPEDEDSFIVSEAELGICLHHGNFKLFGPASRENVPAPEQILTSSPEPIEDEVDAVSETNEETEQEE